MQTASLGHDDIKFYPPPINHRSREHHYTKQVSHIEECKLNLWVMMTLSYYVFSWSLVFHKKDLCEAKVNSKVCSKKADGPPHKLALPSSSNPSAQSPTTPKMSSPTNLPQMQISLIHQTYPGWQIPHKLALPSSANPSVQSPTTPQRPSPAHLPQIQISLLHQTGPC